MAILQLKAEKRTQVGSAACRKLRDADRVPGVVYGHKLETVPVTLAREDLEGALRARFRTAKLQIDGAEEQVVLKEVQHDALGERLLHVDFARVSEHEVITLNVEIRLQGIAAGVKDGGVLDQQIQEVEVECPADQIPERITVVVDDLAIESSIRLGDLSFPEGVRPTQDAGQVVVTVRRPEEDAEEIPAEPEAAGKEPEVITAREKKEEEEE
ncbi:MAG: 50S ribosomal protein L25 [Planctomycetota bacterium]|nr:50S ribosomal protein L25 [Planctomycetota bacterium]